MNNGRLIMMVGIPGSGKSTFAKEFVAQDKNRVYISRDEIRFLFVQDPKHYFDRENDVWREFINRIDMHLADGKDVVVDATHISVGSRMKLRRAVTNVPSATIAIYIQTPFEECMRRNQLRTGMARVPDNAMFSMKNNLQIPTYREGLSDILVYKDNQLMRVERKARTR